MSIPEPRVPSGQRKSIQTEKVNENGNIMVSDIKILKASSPTFWEQIHLIKKQHEVT